MYVSWFNSVSYFLYVPPSIGNTSALLFKLISSMLGFSIRMKPNEAKIVQQDSTLQGPEHFRRKYILSLCAVRRLYILKLFHYLGIWTSIKF